MVLVCPEENAVLQQIPKWTSLRSFKVLSYAVVLKETCPEVTVWDVWGGTEPPPRSHTANELSIGISDSCDAATKVFHAAETAGHTTWHWAWMVMSVHVVVDRELKAGSHGLGSKLRLHFPMAPQCV